jgi:hypothetical protein
MLETVASPLTHRVTLAVPSHDELLPDYCVEISPSFPILAGHIDAQRRGQFVGLL